MELFKCLNEWQKKSPWLLGGIVPRPAAELLLWTVFFQLIVTYSLAWACAQWFHFELLGLLANVVVFALGFTIPWISLWRSLRRFLKPHRVVVVPVVCLALFSSIYGLVVSTRPDKSLAVLQGNMHYLIMLVSAAILLGFGPQIQKYLTRVRRFQVFGLDVEVDGEVKTLAISSFKHLMSALSDLLDDGDIKGKFIFTAYTPAIGCLAHEDDWKRLYQNIARNIHRMEIVCLNENHLETWHNEFIGKPDSHGTIEEKNSTDATEVAEDLIKWIEYSVKSPSVRRLEFRQHPQHYIFKSESRAIVVIPFYVPKILDNGSLDSNYPHKGRSVEMAGIVTRDPKILSILNEAQKQSLGKEDYDQIGDKKVNKNKDLSKSAFKLGSILIGVQALWFLPVVTLSAEFASAGLGNSIPVDLKKYLTLNGSYFLGALVASCTVLRELPKKISYALIVVSLLSIILIRDLRIELVLDFVLKMGPIILGGVILFLTLPLIRNRYLQVTSVEAFGVRAEITDEQKNQKDMTLPLSSFRDLVVALNDLIKTSCPNGMNICEKIRFTAYTPALGYLARQKNESKILQGLLKHHSKHISMTSLNVPDELEKWHKGFKGMITNLDKIEDKHITEANRVSLEIVETITQKGGSCIGYEFSEFPQYYLFASESRAILVIPFNAPTVSNNNENNNSKQIPPTIQMIGLVTNNQKLIHTIQGVHDEYHDTAKNSPSQKG